jgi:hypothetical protein
MHLDQSYTGAYLLLYLTPAVCKQVLPALCSLSFEDSNKSEICRGGGLQSIISAVRDPRPDVCQVTDAPVIVAIS